MSKRKDWERAQAGHLVRNRERRIYGRTYICPFCHEQLTRQFVKVGDYYFHSNCPKTMRQLREVSDGTG